MFYVELRGFDTHSDYRDAVARSYTDINIALTTFVAEMKAQVGLSLSSRLLPSAQQSPPPSQIVADARIWGHASPSFGPCLSGQS